MRRAKYLQTRRKWDVRRQTLNIFIYSETGCGILHFNACRATFRGTWGILDESAYCTHKHLSHQNVYVYISACTQRAIIMEIAARTMHSIPYIKFIHVQPTAYIYSICKIQRQQHIEGFCLRGGAAFWLISLSAACIVLRTALIYILIRYQPGHALPI